MGSEITIEIRGKEYVAAPIDFGGIRKAEKELIRQSVDLREQAEMIAIIAKSNPKLAERMYDRALEKKTNLPAEKVLKWMMETVDGFIWTMNEQLKSGSPEAYRSGELSFEIVESELFKLATENQEEFGKLQDERNVASDLSKPTNPTKTPSQEDKGSEADEVSETESKN